MKVGVSFQGPRKLGFALLGAAFAFAFLALSQGAVAIAGGNGNIPAPSGNFAGTTTGSFAVCLSSDFTKEVACNSTGAVAVPLTFLSVGNITVDKDGNACGSAVDTVSDLPVDASPPMVTHENDVSKLTDYDPSTGSGDVSFTGYTGGKCNGSSFDNTNATQISSGTEHFTVSENGKRSDALITSLTDPTNGIGDFSLSAVARKQ